jgi:multiple sugar transport system substrate-binding protein
MLVMLFVMACAGPVATVPAPESGGSEGGLAAEPVREAVTLTYWRAGGVGSTLGKDQEEIIAAFEAENPDIQVEVEIIPFAQYDQDSQTTILGQEGPNILEVNSVSLGAFTSKGLVQPLDDLLAGSSIQAERFYPGAWAAGHIQGKVWGLPLDTGTRLVLYNKDLFEAAGVEPFGDTVTWEELLAAAEAINNPDEGVYGWGYAAGERWLSLYDGFGHFAVQNNAIFIDDAGTVTVDSPEMLETLEFYKKLTSYGPADAMNWSTLAEIEQQFAAGKVAMYIAGWWSMDGAIAANENLSYGIAMPGNKVVGSSTGGWLVSIPNWVAGAEREAAWKFMEFIFEPANNAKWTDLVSNQAASPNLKLTADRYQPFLDILPDSRHPLPLIPELPELADVLQVEIQRMLLGETTPEEAQAAIKAEFEAVLE